MTPEFDVEFLGSQPNGTAEWRCLGCNAEFELRLTSPEDFSSDANFCPFCVKTTGGNNDTHHKLQRPPRLIRTTLFNPVVQRAFDCGKFALGFHAVK